MFQLRVVGAVLPVLLLGAIAGDGLAAARGFTTVSILFQGDGDGFVDRNNPRQRLCGSAEHSAFKTCVVTVPLGETLRLVAAPESGSAFILWQGCENKHYDGTANCLVKGNGGTVKVQVFLSRQTEPAAISSLRTLVSSRAMYYQGDVESDDTYDYATELADPEKGEMIDGVLGTDDPPPAPGRRPDQRARPTPVPK